MLKYIKKIEDFIKNIKKNLAIYGKI